MADPIRVLVVDDSATVRRVLSQSLSREPDFVVVGEVGSAPEARAALAELRPDVVTLDLEMPGGSGLDLLRWVMANRPLPVIVVSGTTTRGAEATVAALQAGAFEVVTKPPSSAALPGMLAALHFAIRAASVARRAPAAPRVEAGPREEARSGPPSLIAIGASTGGTQAIAAIVRELPATCPPVVITQHLPAGFTAPFAKSLDASSRLEVREARDGDVLRPGLALVAPGHIQLGVHGGRGGYVVRYGGTALVSGHCPSVDFLFNSVARAAAGDAVGVLLTGMGRDGAQGMLAMRQAGARTIAQDEASCVVFGMPKSAIEVGAAGRVLALSQIALSLRAMCGLGDPARGQSAGL